MILLPQRLFRREWCIGLLFVDNLLGLAFDILLLEVRQEAVPVLAGKLRVLSELPLYHQLFNVVDGVYVLECVEDDLPDVLEGLEVSHGGHCVALHEDVALSQQFQRLQRHAVRPDQPLPPLHKTLLVTHDAPDFYNVAKHIVVVQNFHCLLVRDATGQQFNKVPRPDYGIRVPCLPSSFNYHRTFDEVKLSYDLKLRQLFLGKGPYFLKVFLPILREQDGEGGFLKQTIWVIIRLKFIHLPFIEIGVVVPRFFFAIFLIFIYQSSLFYWLCFCC